MVVGEAPVDVTAFVDLSAAPGVLYSYRILAVKGAEIVTVPAAFTFATTRDHWEVLLRARAIEGQAFVVAANQIGEHAPGKCQRDCIHVVRQANLVELFDRGALPDQRTHPQAGEADLGQRAHHE